MSDAAWDITLAKLMDWQTRMSICYPVPCCEALCMYTGGCCCACAPCLMLGYSRRDSWEERVEKDLNGMLKKFNLRCKFESEGLFTPMNVYARFYWR